MAMVRSSLKGMWNLSSEGVTYLYTGAKMGASFMFGTWRRGLMSLLVLASLPFLAPVILVSMMVGGVFLGPSLCGVIAYCVLFRPAALSNFIKWFRSPKSVLGSGPRSAELVMEDLNTDSEYVIVTNETDQSEPQEFDVSSLLSNAKVVEIEAFELRSPSRSTAENIFEEPNAFEAVPVTEEDKIAALIAVKSMQDDEVRSSGEGSITDIVVKPHLEQILGSDTIAREVDAADSDERATMLMEGKQQGKDDEVVNDRELNESELPAFEHVKTVTVVDHQDLSALKQVEEFNRLDEGLAEAQSAYEEPAASEEPEYVVESKAIEGEGGEDHPADQVNAQRKEHEYLEESDEVKEVKEVPSEVKTFEGIREQTKTGLLEPQPVSEDSRAPVTHLEQSNVDNDDSSVDHSGAGHPVHIAREQQQLEKPKFLNEGTTEAQSDLKAVGEPENLVESEVVEKKEDEGHTVDQLTLGKEEKRFDEYNEEIKESGQIVSASTQLSLSEEKPEHSEHVPPLRDAVQQVDDFVATEGESEPNYESAPDSFSPSENEQEQVDAIEIYGRKLHENTAHGLEVDTKLNLKRVDPEEDVPVDEVDAPVVREKEVELPVSEPTSEKEVPGVQEGAVAAPALEPVAPVIEEKNLSAEEVASMADVAPVEVAAPVKEAIVKKTSGPASQVNEQEEVEAPARAPEVMKEVGAPVVEDISIVEPETTKKPDVNPAAPQVLIEDRAAIVQEKRIDIPLVVSEPTSEEKEVLAVEEGDVPAPSLKSEVLIIEHHPLPVESEAVDLASPAAAADVLASADAAPAEVVASAEDSDAHDLYKGNAPVVEAREVKSSAPMEDVKHEGVEDSEPPGLAEKGAETFVEEAAAPETATSEVSIPIVEPEVTQEVEGKLDDASVGLEKEMGDSVLESTSSISEQHSVPVDSEPVELASPIADVPAVTVATPTQERSVKAGTSEVDSLVVEPDVAREAAAESAALEVGAEEEVRFIQEKEAELSLVASEPVSEEREVPVFEEKDACVSSLGSGTSIKEQHALPVETEPVDVVYPVADVQEAGHMEEAVPVEARAEKVEFPEIPVMEDKDMKAPVAALEKVNVEESPVVIAPAQEGAAPVAEAPIVQPELTNEVKEKSAASKAVEEDGDVELPPVVPEPVTEETETPVVAEPAPALESQPVFVEKSLLEEAAPVEDTAPVREGVVEEGEKSEASEMDVKKMKAPLVALQETPTSEDAAPEAEVPVADVEGTKESKADRTVPEVSVEAQTLQDKVGLPSVVSGPTVEAAGVREPSISTGSVAGALLIAGKSFPAEDSIQVQQPEPPLAEKEVDAHVAETHIKEGNFGYPVESHIEQDVFPTLKPLNIIQSKDSAYDDEAKKSNSILISAPAQRRISFEGVGADDDVNMGAPHSRISVSPSDSPSSPAEIGRQIREEIGSIQKIIGQEIPPQYSLWKEVETLSQIVGMELPYMGDVSDLTKARHGLDLLKVVVGMK